MEIFSLGLLAPILTYFMKTVRVLSRHCLLLSWLKHYWVKGLFIHSGSSRYQSRHTGEVPPLVHFTSPTATELLLLQDFFLLHPKKAVVCYSDLVVLLLGDYKTAPHCYFPLFWLHLQSFKKMNPAKITSQRISNWEKEEVWKPRPGWARMVNWDSGCVLIPCCAASVSALSSTERRHDAPATALFCCWEQKGTSGGFPIPCLL